MTEGSAQRKAHYFLPILNNVENLKQAYKIEFKAIQKKLNEATREIIELKKEVK